jgi:hypothetical protein
VAPKVGLVPLGYAIESERLFISPLAFPPTLKLSEALVAVFYATAIQPADTYKIALVGV